MSNETVVVTGFGPFGGSKENASWHVALSLKTLDIEEELGVTLYIEHLPVSYSHVTEAIPILWRKYKPVLVVHLGEYPGNCVRIECVANRSGYLRNDIYDQLPEGSICPSSTEETITCELDLISIARNALCSQSSENIITSEDCGRYLCEFTYFSSLSINAKRTIFIHVPRNLSTVASSTKAVKQIILNAVHLIRETSQDFQ